MRWTEPASPAATGTGLRIFLPALVFLALLSTLWALASPIFSAPDENAHGTKAIAQARGEFIGHEVAGEPYLVVDLPPSYAYPPGLICFARAASTPADCGPELGSPTGQRYFSTWVGAYNPVYYELVAWPTLLLDGSAGVYGMRVISGLVAAVLLAWAFQAAFASRRTRWMAAGVVFLASPMVIYMAGSVTPQGLEIASAAALWVGLLRLLQAFDAQHDSAMLPRWYLWVIVAVSAALLATARATGPLWVVIVVLTCLAIGGWASTKRLFTAKASYLPIAIVAAAGLFSVLWTFGGGSLSGTASPDESPGAGRGFLYGAWSTLRYTPTYVLEAAGRFGWLDTDLPPVTYSLFFIGFALLVVLAVVATHRRGLLTVGGVIVLAVVVPVLVQGYSVRQTGIIWQGRYGLFLYVGIALVAALVLSSELGSRIAFLSVRMTTAIAILLGGYGLIAFVLVLRRYVIGYDVPISRMVTDPQWQPPMGWITLTILFAIVMGLFTAWIIRLAVVSARFDPLSALPGESAGYRAHSTAPRGVRS